MTEVTFNSVLQPAPACYPPDVNSLLQLIAGGGITGTLPDNAGGGAYVGSAAPPDSLTNKVWFKVDGAGRPLGVYMFYSGHWRRLYTGAGIGEIRMMWYGPSEFDGTGRGTIGGNWDGWAICNGQNGTPDLSTNFFPVTSNAYGAGGYVVWDYNANTWETFGGAEQGGHFLSPDELPHLRVRTGLYGTTGAPAGYNLSGGTDGAGTAPGYATATVRDQNMVAVGREGTGLGQKRMPMPRYVAIGFVMFVGYA
jgi:hypothetical protein